MQIISCHLHHVSEGLQSVISLTPPTNSSCDYHKVVLLFFSFFIPAVSLCEFVLTIIDQQGSCE